jgi:hypothetical protein
MKGGNHMTDKQTDTFADEVRAAFETAENVRPETIAAALRMPNGKTVRGFLRATYTRPVEMKGSTWLLTNEQAKATIEHFLARRMPNATESK